jgi:hypothetical protein
MNREAAGHAASAGDGPAPVYTIQGRPVPMPVVVRDASAMTAMYLVPTAAARALVTHPDLNLLELVPGRAVCVLAAIEYRDNDLGRYNEFAVNFFVRHGGQPPTPFFGLLSAFRTQQVGAYIHWLPVTTSYSCDAGRDIWGFPKTVEDIVFEDRRGWRSCTVTAGGTDVVTLTVRRSGRREMPEMPQDSFAVRDGVLFKTPSRMRGSGVGTRPGGARLQLGEHPRARELRTLGLPRRALLSTFTAHMQATFAAPIQL